MKPVTILIALLALPFCSCRALPNPSQDDASPADAPVRVTLPSGIVELPPAAALLARLRSLPSSNAVVCVMGVDSKVRSSVARKALADAGAEQLGSVPGGAYLARGVPAQLATALNTGLFPVAREYLPSDKGVPPPPDAAPAVFVVLAFPGMDLSALRTMIAANSGCEVLAEPSEASLRVRMAYAGFHSVAAIPSVQSIGRWFEPALTPAGRNR